MKKNNRSKDRQKGLVQILLIIGIVVAIGIIGYVLYVQRFGNSLTTSNLYNPRALPTAYQGSYQTSGQAVAPIQNKKDLDNASASLDLTNTTQIDSEINALNTASAGF